MSCDYYVVMQIGEVVRKIGVHIGDPVLRGDLRRLRRDRTVPAGDAVSFGSTAGPPECLPNTQRSQMIGERARGG